MTGRTGGMAASAAGGALGAGAGKYLSYQHKMKNK